MCCEKKKRHRNQGNLSSLFLPILILLVICGCGGRFRGQVLTESTGE